MIRPPSRLDPTVWRASQMIGGAWGRHGAVRRGAWWTPVRWLLAMTMVTLLLGFWQKSPCADGQWDNYKQYTHACYSDVIPLWSDERLDTGAVPYRDTAVEYPVLTGAFMWVTADLTRGVHLVTSSFSELELFGVLTAVLLAVCALVTTVATARANRARPFDAAIFALSPLLLIHAFTNWDLLAMAFTSGALWAWSRDRPVLAGALIALGTSAKLYPGLLLVPLLALAWRTGRWRGAGLAVASAAGTWLAVNGPIALAYWHGWWTFYQFSADRAAERSSVWAIFRTATSGSFSDADSVSWTPPGTAVALLVLLGVAAVVALALMAPVRPRVAQLTFLVVLVFLLTTKVWSPQYSLWLVPLIALARPRWRLTLVWQCCEVLVWIATLYVLIGGDVSYRTGTEHESVQYTWGLPYGWLVLVLLMRDGLLIALAAMVVREMWHPWLDVVRVDGVDDPQGGPFDGAPDAAPRGYPAQPADTDGPGGPPAAQTAEAR